jgi:hypothetical protein
MFEALDSLNQSMYLSISFALFLKIFPEATMLASKKQLYTANIYDRIMIKLQPMVVPLLPILGSSHW